MTKDFELLKDYITLRDAQNGTPSTSRQECVLGLIL
jgi:hypothetical protein